jgi:hypothetical protein
MQGLEEKGLYVSLCAPDWSEEVIGGRLPLVQKQNKKDILCALADSRLLVLTAASLFATM